MKQLKITHIYPDLLNLYGDKGNVQALVYRAAWRNVDCVVTEVNEGDALDLSDTDILILGGGGDKEQLRVLELLQDKKQEIQDYAAANGVLLATCGGYEILCATLDVADKTIDGLGVLHAKATRLQNRKIGDVVMQCDLISDTVVGFENRSCEIQSASPLGKVTVGKSETDGTVQQNVIATHLCGPVLPKNPKLTDLLLERALAKKYGEADLAALDDQMEQTARNVVAKRFEN